VESGEASNAIAFSDLASTLWQLRELLDTLLFKIVEERVLIAADQSGWLPKAHREVESALAETHALEVQRASQATALTGQLSLTSDATLTSIAAAAPQRWATIYVDHHAALSELLADINALAETGSLQRREPDPELPPGAVRAAIDKTLGEVTQLSLREFLS
jgi:hypothetical protein